VVLKNFPFHRQPDSKDCGPACLKMIMSYHEKSISMERLRVLCETNRMGTSLQHIANGAERAGLRTMGVKVSLDKITKEAPFPCILLWKQRHYVVLYGVKNDVYYVADPGAPAKITYSKQEFINGWINEAAGLETELGIALLLQPTPKFFDTELEDGTAKKLNFSFIFKYLR